MKTIEVKILPYQEKHYFSPIRDKVDYAKVLVIAIRNLLLSQYNNDNTDSKSSMKLFIDRMSRLFFYKEEKFYSISFPFSVIIDEQNIIKEITTLTGREINSKIISEILSVLNDTSFKINPSLTEYCLESNEIHLESIPILDEIFLSEPGYIRYDIDEKNENGKIHPLNHLDINYSTYNTLKLGLNDFIGQEYFENILNTKTECSFITK